MACDIHLNAYFFQAPPKAFYIPDFISVEEESYLLDHVCKLNLWGHFFRLFVCLDCLLFVFAFFNWLNWGTIHNKT